MLFGEYFGASIIVHYEHDVLGHMADNYHGAFGFLTHAFLQPAIYLAFSGLFVAWYCYVKRPDIPQRIAASTSLVYTVLTEKYGFDRFNDWFFAGGARGTGRVLWRAGDVALIDGLMVNGSARTVRRWAGVIRLLQSGYLYHYAFAMIIGLLVLLGLFVHRVVA